MLMSNLILLSITHRLRSNLRDSSTELNYLGQTSVCRSCSTELPCDPVDSPRLSIGCLCKNRQRNHHTLNPHSHA